MRLKQFLEGSLQHLILKVEKRKYLKGMIQASSLKTKKQNHQQRNLNIEGHITKAKRRKDNKNKSRNQ